MAGLPIQPVIPTFQHVFLTSQVTEMASEERARRISVARAARAHDYRLARLSKTTAMARLHAEAEARAAALKAEKAARKARRNRRFNGPVSELAGVDEDEDQDFEPATLPVIIKGDVQGSLEAVESALAALSGEQVIPAALYSFVVNTPEDYPLLPTFMLIDK